MTYKKVVYSKYSPEFKIRVVLEGLKPNSIGRTCRKYKISSPLFYLWQQEILEGTKIHMDHDYATSKHPNIIKFRHELEGDLVLRNKRLEQENAFLKAHLALIRPTKKSIEYTEEEKRKLISRIKKSSCGLKKALLCLGISKSSYQRWRQNLKNPKPAKRILKKKVEQKKYINAVFKLIHSPPRLYRINRTSWRLVDIYSTLKKTGIVLSRISISKIIKNAGYNYRMAKRVLTSRDLYYQDKLDRIHKILKHLKANEGFFSIDEFGPFAVKKMLGRQLVAPGQKIKVQEIQKSKGPVTVIGALELRTNQITHLAGINPNTDLTLELVNLLREKYSNYKKLYLSWDSAQYHSSKKLVQEVEILNQNKNGPQILFAPLPSSSQFLNVIESVFGALQRAILDNSNYRSRNQCILAIQRYIDERNLHYKIKPKRAGDKIWRGELSKTKFRAANNCVEPVRWSRHYRPI